MVGCRARRDQTGQGMERRYCGWSGSLRPVCSSGCGGYILCVSVAILMTERSDIIDTLCAQKTSQTWLIIRHSKLNCAMF